MKIPEPHRLPSGTWYIQMRLGGGSQYVTAATETECRRRAELIKAEHRNGLRDASAPAARTLGKCLSDYISSRKNVLSPSTLAGYDTIKRTRFQPYMKRQLGRINWQRMVNEEAPLCSPKTLSNAFALICAAVESAGLKRPTASLPQIVRNEHPFLSADQIPAFLDALREKPVELAALLGLHGLRRSEIIGLEWSDVDLKKQVIHVRGAVVRGEDGFVKKATNKNTYSRRTVPIIIPRLSELLAGAGEKRGQIVTSYPNKIYDNVNKVCRAAGLPEIGCHGLRHTFVSLCYSQGIQPMEAMKLGGYGDLATMQRIYTHISEQSVTAAADKLKAFYTESKAAAKK